MPLKEKNPGPTKVLLSGGTGFLGSYIAKNLVSAGFEVSILIRETSKLTKLEDILEDISLIDINDFAGGSFSYFIHAATVYGRNKETKNEMWESNVDFPLSLLSKLDLKSLQFINLNTSLPPETNLYAQSKHEFVDKAKSQFPGLQLSNLLLEQFYGPKDGTFLTFLVENFKKGTESIKLTEGLQIRDFIYYEDVISAIRAIMEQAELGDIPVGTGMEITLKDIVLLASELTKNEKTELLFGAVPYRENEVMKSVADTEKLKNIGWSPEYSIREGILKTLENW